jgi:DNA-binding SARP family transcriptional activator/tetratricopeptide (TPR) repeat protein
VKRLDVRLLGDFRVEVDSREVPAEAWKHGRATQLVKLLSLAPRHRMERDRVVEALWPHLEPDAGAANLHKAASYARRALGDRGAVVLRGGQVELAPDADVSTDLERIEAGEEAPSDDELLPDDRYEEWTVEPRERLRARRLDLLSERGNWEQVLAEDPTNEDAHRALMRRHVEAGDRAAAVRQFRRLRDELAALGLTPEAETLALMAEISRGPAVQARPQVDLRLHGRDDEVRVLDRAIARAEGGRGGTIALVGEAGIGKTRLAEAAQTAAAAGGCHVLRGTARPDSGITPYGPVAEALEPLLQERPDLLSHIPEGAATTLASLMPRDMGRDDGVEGSLSRQEVVASIAELLGVASRERGLLLCLEDMHAADDATVQLVRYIAGRAVGSRMLIVLCVRDRDQRPSVAELRSSLVQQGIGVDLAPGPLDGAAVEAIAEGASGRPVPADTLAAIARASAGNPFFVEELAAGVDVDGEVTVPGHLNDLLDAHLDRLGEAADELLPSLAVLEEPFDVVDVAALEDMPKDEALEALGDAAGVGVLEPAGAESFRFRHPLLREGAHQRTPDERLAAAHAKVAERLAAEGAPPEQIAHHLLGAGLTRAAVPRLAEAAQWARSVAAFGEGLAWVEEALRHADEAHRAELLPLLAELRHRTGAPGAAAAYEQAVAVTTDAQRRISLRVEQARACLATGDSDAASRVLDNLDLETAGAADRARATLVRGLVSWHMGNIEEARKLSTEAAALYEDAGLASEMGDQEDLAAMVAHADGQWTRHVRWRLGETWELPEVAGRVYDAYLCVTEYVMQAGDPYDELRDFAKELRVHARRAGARRGEAFATTVLGEAELLSGDPESAAQHLAEATTMSREVRATASEALARARLGEALLQLDDREGAAVQVEEALGLAYHSSLSQHLLPLAHGIGLRAPADPAEAMERLERADAILDEGSMCQFCRVGFLVAAASVCASSGERQRGWDFLTRAEQAASLWTEWTPWNAAIARARAELLLAEERAPEAAVELRRAIDGFAASGQRLNERRAREALSQVA